MKTQNQSTSNSYRNATGNISVTLRNDMMLHYVMQKSKCALKGLICSLKGLDPDTVQDVQLLNPIDYGTYNTKEVILDIKVIFNNSGIMDIELQMYHDAYWEKRSLLYLCRTYDSIGTSDKYSDLKPATLVAIVPKPLFPNHPEFYSTFQLLNKKYHYPYTSNLHLNVLDLSQMELATEEDRSNGLLHWAKLFLANTWEELVLVAGKDQAFQEVINHMYTVNTIPEERTLFEAHQKWLAVNESMQASREETEAALKNTLSKLEDTRSQLDDTRSQLDGTKSQLSDTKSQLDDTKSQLDDTKSQLDDTKSQLDDTKSQLDDTRSILNSKEAELSQAKSENEALRQFCLANGLDPSVVNTL